MLDDAQLRVRALELAVKAYSGLTDINSILLAADRFYQFLIEATVQE
jgi:hypothetical protein